MRSRGLLLMALYGPTFTLLVLAGLVAKWRGMNVGLLTRDIAQIAEVNPLYGIVSNAGILLLSFAAAVCLFTAAVLRQRRNTEASTFFLWSGTVTAIGLVDDLFAVHDDLAERYFGLTEHVPYLLYLVPLGVFLMRYRSFILQTTAYRLLLIALMIFAASTFFDLVEIVDSTWNYLIEDGLKLIAITSWLGYFAFTAFELTSSARADLPVQ